MKLDIRKFATSLLELNQTLINIVEVAFDKGKEFKDSFEEWYRGKDGTFAKYMIRMLVLLSILNISGLLVSIGALEDYQVIKLLSAENIKTILYISEIFILILISINVVVSNRFKTPPTDNEVLQRGFMAADRFLNYWPLLWFSWFALYVILVLPALGLANPTGNVFLAAINACNNLSGVFILSMYLEMAENTENRSQYGKKFWIISCMILVVLLMLQLILTAKLSAPAEIAYLFSFTSGILVGIVTGLLVTKLASRIIDAPMWVVAVLVLYAVIQPAFPIIAGAENLVSENPGLGHYIRDNLSAALARQVVELAQADLSVWNNIFGAGSENVVAGASVSPPSTWGKLTIIVALIALYGKVMLFSVVHWLRDTDRLAYYMIRAKWLYEETKDAELRQIFELAVKVSKWRRSGQPRELVEKHADKWSEEEVESLVTDLQTSRELQTMNPNVIKVVLEETRREWMRGRWS